MSQYVKDALMGKFVQQSTTRNAYSNCKRILTASDRIKPRTGVVSRGSGRQPRPEEFQPRGRPEGATSNLPQGEFPRSAAYDRQSVSQHFVQLHVPLANDGGLPEKSLYQMKGEKSRTNIAKRNCQVNAGIHGRILIHKKPSTQREEGFSMH